MHDESDVTWRHVIVHGCKGQKYLHVRAHMRPDRPRRAAQAAPCTFVVYTGLDSTGLTSTVGGVTCTVRLWGWASSANAPIVH